MVCALYLIRFFCPNQSHNNLALFYSSFRSLRSVIHFEFRTGCCVMYGLVEILLFCIFACGCPIVLALLGEGFSFLHSVAEIFVKNQLIMYVCICFWNHFFSIDLGFYSFTSTTLSLLLWVYNKSCNVT